MEELILNNIRSDENPEPEKTERTTGNEQTCVTMESYSDEMLKFCSNCDDMETLVNRYRVSLIHNKEDLHQKEKQIIEMEH